ncbi:putative extracellular SCP domain protein Pry1 [Aspergillus candidus]|uniref:CAP domain-containing protein n=1 Tax=Aspergillus candidus TaxID=41067 RepID=A0A2I2FLT6_ASPCN|nr:CAP domain-containing protein [Aspergillus candidus]PLB41564.1 CAP domain-containing protein [Aspergillus candidus]
MRRQHQKHQGISLLALLTLTLTTLPAPTTATPPPQTTQTTVHVTMTPTAPQPPSYTSPDIFRDTVLAHSNDYRRSHNASALVWNETLTDYAADWAGGCKWEHSHGPYGENLAFGYPDPASALAAWADESQMYNYDIPTGFTEETGHFTQLVWRGTEQVGCAAIDCGFRDSDSDSRKTRAQKDSTLGKYEMAQGWYVVSVEYVFWAVAFEYYG